MFTVITSIFKAHVCVCWLWAGSCLRGVDQQQDFAQRPGRDGLSERWRALGPFTKIHSYLFTGCSFPSRGKNPRCLYFVHTLPSAIGPGYCTFYPCDSGGKTSLQQRGRGMTLDRLCAPRGAASGRGCCFTPWHAQAGPSLCVAWV